MIATVHPAGELHPSLVTADRYFAAQTFGYYLASVVKHREWWHDTHRLASASDDQIARANALTTPWRLLALSEDWCGDAINVLPYIACLAGAAPRTLELRVLGRDANPDIMNAHLTGLSRSIPVVIALDGNHMEHGWWGPRPLALQEQAMGAWWTLPKDDRRLRIRTWYARDRGEQILEEILQLLEGSEAMK